MKLHSSRTGEDLLRGLRSSGAGFSLWVFGTYKDETPQAEARAT